MGATYTRQSTYSDGDVITAAHTNDEFNQLLAAFQASSGHTHDGTANEGGPITKMLGTSLTLGDGTASTDITVTFDGESNDGVLKWMEDEDYFEFSDDILVASTEKIQFGDTATFLQQSSDGVLRIDGEATIDLNASTAVTVSNDLKLDSDSAVLGFGADNDVTLTHVADTALLLNDAIKLTFRDSALSVSSSTDGQLDIDADTEVEITTPLLEISADATVGDDLTLKSDAAVLGFGADTDTTLTHVADTGLLLNSTRQLQFGDSGTYIHQSADGVLDLVADTEIEINATTIDINGAADISGNLAVGGNLTVTGTMDFGDSNISNVGSIALDTITNDGTDITLDSSGDIILDAGGANITFKDDGTSILDIANNSSDVELTVSVADKNFAIKGTDDSSAITALDIDMALNGKATFSGDVVVTGDLTVTGDDITMGTNTSGHIMVADGANFNPVAVSGDVTIASNGAVTIANGAVETAMVNANVITGQTAETSLDTSNDTILIHDADAGSLKKTTLASISSALGGITDVVADTSPQLGGNLDTNSHNILIDDAHFIADENGNEQIIFNTTSSAINQFEITNAAAHGGAFVKGPHLKVSGGDTNLDLNLEAKGTGSVVIKGRSGTGNEGAVQFNCENNSHGQVLKAQPHSAGVTNTMLLPAGSSSTLVSLVSTDTLTNKSIDSDNNTITNIVNADIKSSAAIADTKLDTISTAGKVALSALEIDGGTDIGEALVDADLIVVDNGAGGTNRKSAMSRVATYIESGITGDISISSGTAAIGSGVIVNADVNTSAALEFSKMENLTASRALVSDSNGDVSAATTTSTEIGYVNGVTSAIQTQLDAKASKGFATAMAIAL